MAASSGAVGAGIGGVPLVTGLAPPPYVIRYQTGTSLPTSFSRILEALGGVAIGAALPSILTALMPANEQIFAPIVAGGIGTLAAMASPIGTWGAEIGASAMASSAFILFLKATNQMPGVL